MTLAIDYDVIEETAKLLYIRALKILPDDIKRGFERLTQSESDGTARTILATMRENIVVAERTNNLLCQDTGIPIYNVVIGRNVALDGVALKGAIRRGCTRATKEHPLRSSVVHPITRVNEHTSGGRFVPVINIDFDERRRNTLHRDDPQGLGLGERLVPQDVHPGRRHRGGEDLRHRPRHRGGRQGLPADHRRGRRRRHLRSLHASRQGRSDAAARLATAPIPRARRSRRS